MYTDPRIISVTFFDIADQDCDVIKESLTYYFQPAHGSEKSKTCIISVYTCRVQKCLDFKQ